jgi:hypothetical protein
MTKPELIDYFKTHMLAIEFHSLPQYQWLNTFFGRGAHGELWSYGWLSFYKYTVSPGSFSDYRVTRDIRMLYPEYTVISFDEFQSLAGDSFTEKHFKGIL